MHSNSGLADSGTLSSKTWRAAGCFTAQRATTIFNLARLSSLTCPGGTGASSTAGGAGAITTPASFSGGSSATGGAGTSSGTASGVGASTSSGTASGAARLAAITKQVFNRWAVRSTCFILPLSAILIISSTLLSTSLTHSSALPRAEGVSVNRTVSVASFTGYRGSSGILLPAAATVPPLASRKTRTAITAVAHRGCQPKKKGRRSLFSSISWSAERNWYLALSLNSGRGLMADALLVSKAVWSSGSSSADCSG